jgi:cytochrome c peroxidase
MTKRSILGCVAVVCAGVVAGMLTLDGQATAHENEGHQVTTENAFGLARTISVNGPIDGDNPFFKDLGSNGRRCATCHRPDNAFSITPESVQERFAASRGMDPIFSNNDGSNCQGAQPQSLKARKAAYSLLLSRGVIRIGLDVPAGAEFVVESVADPNACSPASDGLSLYRRPLPTTNLRFVSGVMWDGRESSPTTTIEQDLLHQANTATHVHAEAGMDITRAQARQIVKFETGLYTAQARDSVAGSLHAAGAGGGPAALSRQAFFAGINNPFGINPTQPPFDEKAFTLFDAWALPQPTHERRGRHDDPAADLLKANARAAILRGEVVFNTKRFALTGVGGLNGETFPSGVTPPEVVPGTCSTCHGTPNVGNQSLRVPLNIGVSDPDVAPYLPVYTLRNVVTQDTVQTTDPGRAMVTGKWSDIGRFKSPMLRALAARGPYFHNGSSATLEDVILFYERRFTIGLTTQQRTDLIAFLRAL